MTDKKKIALAELLLRRKELNALFSGRLAAQEAGITRDNVQRRKVNDEIDQVVGHVSLVDKDLLEKETNYYAHQRRLADSVVQQANWTTEVSVSGDLMSDEEVASTGPATVKLAELLVRRKELEDRIRRAPAPHNFRVSAEELFQEISERVPIADGLGDLVTKVKRKAPSELKPFQVVDTLQRKLREVDACIQKTNWDTQVEVSKTVLDNFSV